MTPYHFVLQFDCSQVNGLAARYLKQYQGEDEEALKAGSSIAGGDYRRKNLKAIVRWKSQRRIALIDENRDPEIADALRLAINATTVRSAIAVLCGLNGVEVRVASAILTAIDQQTYTILDFRALESLGITKEPNYSIDYYLGYLEKCRELALQCNTSLRTLDRALWQWSQNKSSSKSRCEDL
jgi:hypothetical protein